MRDSPRSHSGPHQNGRAHVVLGSKFWVYIMGATKLLVQIFWAIVSDRAENLGEGSEAQVSKVDREIFEKICFCLITYRW